MTFETKKAYAEICIVLQYFPDEYIRKIPKKIMELFQNEKLKDYEINIDEKNLFDPNILTKKTRVLLAILNYQYWCPNKQVKNDLYNMYLANNEKYQKEIKEKYNIDKLLKKEEKKLFMEKDNQALVECKRGFMQKIFDKIKILLKIK